MALVHHELCFGCGRTNLFGLLLEADRSDDGTVTARCFIKQDHQGSEPGQAHEGIIAAALTEAMALASGPEAWPSSIEVEFHDSVPVGTFLDIKASATSDGRARAEASSEGRRAASASGSFRFK